MRYALEIIYHERLASKYRLRVIKYLPIILAIMLESHPNAKRLPVEFAT
jgi:hypothetical protein